MDDYGDANADKENKIVPKKGLAGWFGGKKKNEEEPPEEKPVETVLPGVKVESNADLRKVDRRWVRVPGPGGAGRFIPETEAASAAAAAGVELVARAADENSPQPPTPNAGDSDVSPSSLGGDALTGAAAVSADARAAGISYEDWMRSVTTMAVEMEINAQLGEFTVRKNRLKALQNSVREMPDFIAALGQMLLASHNEAKSTRASKTLADVPAEERRRRYLPKNRWRQRRTGGGGRRRGHRRRGRGL